MKEIYFFYFYILIQLISVKIYIEILVKKFKVPCKYGMQAGVFIPIILTTIFILFYKNEENEENEESISLPTLFLNYILFFGLIPLFIISLFLAIYASGLKDEAGGVQPYCLDSNHIVL